MKDYINVKVFADEESIKKTDVEKLSTKKQTLEMLSARTQQQDKLSILKKPTSMKKTRQKTVDLLNEHINIEMSFQIETEILKYTKSKLKEKEFDQEWDNIKVRRIYCQKVRSLLYNIKNSKTLKDLLNSNTVLPDKLVKLSHEDMMPERYEEINRRRIRKETTQFDFEGLYKCEKCKSKKTTYYQLQTRSADEPCTTYIQCLDCMNTWSENV